MSGGTNSSQDNSGGSNALWAALGQSAITATRDVFVANAAQKTLKQTSTPVLLAALGLGGLVLLIFLLKK